MRKDSLPDSPPEIDKVLRIIIQSLHRAISEAQTGNVEFHVPIKQGKIDKIKEVRVIHHN